MINLQASAKRYLARGSNVGQMLPLLHKHFAMIKQKSENERMEQSTVSLRMKNLWQGMNDTK